MGGGGREGVRLLQRAVREPASASWRTAIWLLVGLAVLQGVVGSRIPLDPDESYYWEWSRRLALGYYDHPPGIAYLIRAGTVFFGPTALGVQFVPILAVWPILATSDCPPFRASGLALYTVVRALRAPHGSRSALGWWLGSGAA